MKTRNLVMPIPHRPRNPMYRTLDGSACRHAFDALELFPIKDLSTNDPIQGVQQPELPD